MSALAEPAVTGTCSLTVQSVLYNNGHEDLDRTLDSLARAIEIARQHELFDRVVVSYGDCSPLPVFTGDEIAHRRELLAESGVDELRYEFFDGNLGSADGHNRQLRRLDTDLALILNPDTVMAPDALVELLAPLRRPGVGLVEARQLPIEHPKDYDPVSGDTSWASTACALVPRAVMAQVEGFDAANFFLYCDDVDFSWRVRLAGYKVVYQPSARVFHDKRLNADGSWPVGAAEEYYSAEGALMLAHKYSRPDLVKKIKSDLSSFGSELQRKAVDEFEVRDRDGLLPEPLDPDHAVGQFINGNYAKHRF